MHRKKEMIKKKEILNREHRKHVHKPPPCGRTIDVGAGAGANRKGAAA
jgi:hypothetical protein